MEMMDHLGLDRALEAARTGDFKTLFTSKAAGATLVGAGLGVLAALMACELSVGTMEKLKGLEEELNSDMDLFSYNFSINFDMAIFKNLQECWRLNALGSMISLKELLCGISKGIVRGDASDLNSMWKKMKDAFSFDETTPE